MLIESLITDMTSSRGTSSSTSELIPSCLPIRPLGKSRLVRPCKEDPDVGDGEGGGHDVGIDRCCVPLLAELGRDIITKNTQSDKGVECSCIASTPYLGRFVRYHELRERMFSSERPNEF
jgi:hypothetical protein